MDPVELDDVDVAMLGVCQQVTFATNQPQYRPLPAIVVDGPLGKVVTRWRLTDDERKRLSAGEDLYLTQMTFRDALQPMLLCVGAPDVCPADRT